VTGDSVRVTEVPCARRAREAARCATVTGMRYVKKESALPAVPKAAPAASQAVHNATKGQ
jgi:hypothetical protein